MGKSPPVSPGIGQQRPPARLDLRSLRGRRLRLVPAPLAAANVAPPRRHQRRLRAADPVEERCERGEAGEAPEKWLNFQRFLDVSGEICHFLEMLEMFFDVQNDFNALMLWILTPSNHPENMFL